MVKDNKQDSIVEIDKDNVPEHVAIIMDGNGRWAQKRHLPRIAGHKEGMQTVKKVAIAASDLGVKVLTLYAFSTENWKRPDKEVNFLMKLPVTFFSDFVPDLIKNNVKVQVMGIIDQLPKATQKAVNDAVKQTADCTGMILNFALNYGSRIEIVDAVKQVARLVKDGSLDVDDIDEDIISDHLMSASLGKYADPDLLIRTSGEERISNFLLWQIAYSELEFVDTYWPDFDANTLRDEIIEYQGRHRRFGGLDTE
ncbi:isoprenyl transferase [Lentilactobacillus sp. SPB1-3]|uniref:Isoprenyl transferase n=1 Tax=Lentilactobacillus terminaliae TaxID=3003483 RepID=A0ACD5DC72_9LACO|nr:isoprenyl transferase [Lentilactobacillus sp. SPB1-3]MCZ0977314.1 isoprenyl transferase [Lentilactobacillus sp. SPB1-3]